MEPEKNNTYFEQNNVETIENNLEPIQNNMEQNVVVEQNTVEFVPKKKKGRILIFILIALVVGCLAYAGVRFLLQGHKPVEREVVEKPRLEDDFFNYVNYESIKNATIPNDSGIWSKFYDASKIIETRQDEILEEIFSDPNYKNDRIDKFLEIYNDYETRNKNGYKELQPYFDMIDKANTIEEFNDVSFKLNRDLCVSTIIEILITSDIKDTNKNVLMFNQVKGDLQEFVVYGNNKYARIKKELVNARKELLKTLGYDETKINELSKQIDEYNDYFYGKSLKEEDFQGDKQLKIYDQKYTLDQIKKEFKNIPFEKYLKNIKLDDLDSYIIIDYNQLKAFDEYYNNEHLPIIKIIAKMKVLSDYYELTESGEKYSIELQNKIDGTNTSIEDYRKNEIRAIKVNEVDSELQKRYEAKYFKDEDKKLVADLAEEVRRFYIEIIEKCDWLEASTREEALKKLNTMKINVGYQENNSEDKDKVDIISKSEGGTLMSNYIANNRFNYDKIAKDFNKGPESEKMSTLTVNAYYLPAENSINFLAGFKELYKDETDYYRLMGYFGTVIAHEISHAFDNTGSRFDETGKIRDWWTAKDLENYKSLSQKIIDYYNNYEYMGFKVNGEKTLGENIADLAAMKAMVSIAEKKGATKEDFKKLFEAYANLWVAKSNKVYAENQILADTHSPNMIRVNAVLSSIDKFYEVYDIKEGDKMYVAKENRVGLW